MKKYLTLALTAALIILQSCQKEVSFDPGVVDPGSNPSTPGTVTGVLKCKVDGVQYVADLNAGASRVNGALNITGVNKAGNLVTMTAFVDSGVHKYTLSLTTQNFAAYKLNYLSTTEEGWTTVSSTDPNALFGELNVTAINETKKTISGTFTFKVFNENNGTSKMITDGSFTDLGYVTTIPATPASAGDTLRAKVNGTAFTPTVYSAIKAFGKLNMSGYIGATSGIAFMIPDNITPGTYTLDFALGTYIGTWAPDADATHFASSESGTLTILEHNTSTKRIRGNFNYVASPLLTPTVKTTVTDGYFSFKYQ